MDLSKLFPQLGVGLALLQLPHPLPQALDGLVAPLHHAFEQRAVAHGDGQPLAHRLQLRLASR